MARKGWLAAIVIVCLLTTMVGCNQVDRTKRDSGYKVMELKRP